ncbi:hypothetical protein NEF87_003446 [Candidatus Lokiarchaeum ossiferum]|uniref:Squalene cyclase C-terminal domain-containing protein n=1 Tax=Candidatus Lokiarchaeum ossiferum TaxID=2951803 RepID=A0ABY6HX52_9ARCH|nr:hypothetical protein NEF87_003446 [Candidatus Lokiarchaeum sp. B-35]
MFQWSSYFEYNPIDPLLSSNDEILKHFVKQDLLNRREKDLFFLENAPVVQKIIKKQQPNGSWKSVSKNQLRYPAINYSLIETWRNFRILVEKYRLTKENPAVRKASEYIFSCQTDFGDFRGILANQFAMYYTGALASLLNQAGYEKDPRLNNAMEWLLSTRQDDGGWLATYLMSLNLTNKEVNRLTSQNASTITERDATRPSSHNWTGMVIRAFANHPQYRNRPEAHQAGKLLKKAFFLKDKNYTSYQDAGYWVKFEYPYWWNNLVSAMDSLSNLGFLASDPDIKRGLDWLQDHQNQSGLWNISYSSKHQVKNSPKSKNMQLWVSFQICRIFQRFLDANRNF